MAEVSIDLGVKAGATGLAVVNPTGYIQGGVQTTAYGNAHLTTGFVHSDSDNLIEGQPVAIGVSKGETHPPQVWNAAAIADIGGITVKQGAGNLGFQTADKATVYIAGSSGVNFYPNGCGQEIVVRISSALYAAITEGTTLRSVGISWDFTNHELIASDNDNDPLPWSLVDVSNSSNNLGINLDNGGATASYVRGSLLAKVQI
jgi:hypothetical protein